jgi:SAM-dependent methyltransferase
MVVRSGMLGDAVSKSSYDRVPYTDHAYAESHPDRLCVVARLSGWRAPDVASARVLELGCGRGGNLLPMAAALPAGTFVGVDRSPRQIDEAQRIASETGTGNVRLYAGDFETFELPEASFDYVIAHGVCSWVSPSSRRALLRSVARALAPRGVAYVSFNVLPGWYERLAAREWLRFDGGEGAGASASIRWLREQVSSELSSYRAQLAAVAERLEETGAAYATHEYLAEEHYPQRVTELLAEARDADLTYLGDAVAANTAVELLPEAVTTRVRGLDAARAQQTIDFVRNTAFRRTLLVRSEQANTQGWRWPAHLDASAVESFLVASRLRPVSGAASSDLETFASGDLRVQVFDAGARRALHALASRAPRSVRFDELAQGTDASSRAALRQELFDLWLATGAIEFRTSEPPIADGTSPRPRACPVARWHAVNGGAITNRQHHEVRLLEQATVRVLACLDGQHDAADLRRMLRGSVAPAAAPDPELDAVVTAAIAQIAAAALLVV